MNVPLTSCLRTLALAAVFAFPLAGDARSQPVVEKITDELTVARGTVNQVKIVRDGRALAVYGWTAAADASAVEQVLLTHGRRDVAFAAQPLVAAGVKAVAPARERYYLKEPQAFWQQFTTARYHDYAQQTTKVLARPLDVDRWVAEGDELAWRGLTFRVLETPGFTRGSASYLTRLGDLEVAFTGDLIYGDGQILDLYSFQDEIPSAQIRGYHGYGSRLAELVDSLRKLQAAKPDLIVPARGPVIREPAAAIQRLIGRVQAVYQNYLSTNALHWYFKEQRMRHCGERVLGAGAEITLMPYSQHEQTPSWIFEHSTSRLIIAANGHGFLLDCGYQRVIDAISELMEKGLVKQIDGIFVTHFHDDHTDQVQAAAEKFDCPIYATEEYADVLRHPDRYHLPAMTANPMKQVTAMKDGQTMRWQEFELTFHFFPGQTYYHGGLLVRKPGARAVFFIGDAFAPSGFDDYCVQNRNLLHDDSGYLLCLHKMRRINEPYWLINEHIRHVFSFSADEMDYLEDRYRQRIKLLSELFPWDDPNYGVDEQWAVCYPYGATIAAEASHEFAVRLTNHSPVERTFTVRPRVHGGLLLQTQSQQLTLPPRQSGSVRVEVRAGKNPGHFIVTADVDSDGMSFGQWAETLITVE